MKSVEDGTRDCVYIPWSKGALRFLLFRAQFRKRSPDRPRGRTGRGFTNGHRCEWSRRRS